MKVRLKLLLIVGLLLWAELAAAQVVEVRDSNLRKAVQEALALPDGSPVTQQDMETLKDLRAPNREIADLTGLEYAVNLTRLDLFRNAIVDISPLSQLTKLTGFNLWSNRIVDISPLRNLTKLRNIILARNEIVDISPLAGLTNLVSLDISSNRIVDFSSLANLVNLEKLRIDDNEGTDISALQGLNLIEFHYDSICDIGPLGLTVRERIENRNFPSVFSAWAGIGWSSVTNLPNLSGTEQLALHDLFFSVPHFGLSFVKQGEIWTIMGIMEKAQAQWEAFVDLNPNMIFIVEIRMRDAFSNYLPADSPFWVTDAAGNRVVAVQHTIDPNLFLIDFTHPDMQDMIVNRTIALSKCGLYDGVFFDWWSETGVVLADSNVGWKDGYRGLEAEQRARDNIIQRIRAEVSPDFLIMGNGNRRTFPRNAHYMNGSFMETLRDDPGGYTHEGLREIESTLSWLEENLREPQVNCLEGWGIPTEPPDSPANRRWMRLFTAMSLTHSDGYVLYTAGTNHDHYWYDFWDADLGRPVGGKGQTLGEVEGLFIREFTEGWAVYNRSGAVQSVSLPGLGTPVSDRPEGISATHQLPDLDGEMYLKIMVDRNDDGVVNVLDLILVAGGLGTPSGDVNQDGVTNILDLTLVAQQFE